ncbi:alanine racemase [Aestuariispira insulae]|uniref:Alanine racemase n=1 Tax=Aestuariispira insulae TaxID=1461337 RepID=A0A3D9HVX6_9PROT|nr:alanine racemase [Aestuariispira insulae]RED53565.1 alanine racemase [Aestuariispira insulae]
MNLSHAPCQLSIDLNALRENYRLIDRETGNARVSAVVKYNAYGLGIEAVVRTLWDEGCKTFLTAQLDEALQVRSVLADAEVIALNGLMSGEEQVYLENNLLPTLNDPGQLQRWADFCRAYDRTLPAALHFDTGMSRLGFAPAEYRELAEKTDRLNGIDCRYLFSHLACAEQADHPMNIAQRDEFARVIRAFPAMTHALAASSGVFLGPEWHFGMVRTGLALYGGNPNLKMTNPMRQVVKLKGKILQIREIDAPETVGYGALYTAPGKQKIATIGAGYADGYPRRLSDQAVVMYQGQALPVVGRVSMDLTTVDVTDVPGVVAGDMLDLIGPGQDINDLAVQADTIPYEILTSLGARYPRVYEGE